MIGSSLHPEGFDFSLFELVLIPKFPQRKLATCKFFEYMLNFGAATVQLNTLQKRFDIILVMIFSFCS